MFLELFLERLSCLCEILGRECMQAFCSSWTPNTHNTARSNVIIMFWKKKHCKANWTTLRCPLTPRRERCPGNVVFSSQHTQPTAINHKAPRKNIQSGCQQQQNLTMEGRSQCMAAPIKAVAMASRTTDTGCGKYLFLLRSSVSEHPCLLRNVPGGLCNRKIRTWNRIPGLLPFLLHADYKDSFQWDCLDCIN